MEYRPNSANKPPRNNRNKIIAGSAAAALLCSLGGYAIFNKDKAPTRPALDCTYFKMPDGISTFLEAEVQPSPGSKFEQAPNPIDLVQSIDVKFDDAGPDGPSPVVHPKLYEHFNHQFVNASGIKTNVDVTVHAKPNSGFRDGHCTDTVSFNINPGVIRP